MQDEEIVKQLVEAGEAHARRVLLEEKLEDIMPMWHIRAPDGDSIFGTPFSSDQEKYAIFAYMRLQLKTLKATAFMFMSEAWVSHIKAGEKQKGMPRDDPNRVEVVQIFASTRSKNAIRSLRMDRDAEGRIIDLVLIDEKKPGDLSLDGNIPGLFD